MGPKASPLLLMEMGGRLSHTDLEQGRYWVMKGLILTKLSLLACSDGSSAAALPIAMDVISHNWISRNSPMLTPDNHLKGYTQAVSDDNELTVSPWWACSHGMGTMMWAMQSPEQPYPLSQWYIGDEAYKAKHDEYFDSLRRFLIENGAL